MGLIIILSVYRFVLGQYIYFKRAWYFKQRYFERAWYIKQRLHESTISPCYWLVI